MSNRINRKDLDLLLSYQKKLSRTEISEILGVSESLARTYRGILDNVDVLGFDDEVKDRNVLVIGDLHAPFILDGYLDFCVEIMAKYACNEIVFIGDILDNHYASFHDTDPDGYGALEELEKAKKQIASFYKAFPSATVTIGNHDLLPNRKAFHSGLSASWIKKIEDVLGVPDWNFVEEITIDGVMYTHGVGRQASQRAKNDMTSIVQGHWHSKSYIDHFVGLSEHIWAMQIGCGVDRKTYAMAYGKHFDKPHINCGVVLENGTLPIIEYMNL
jgi:metallophosphoesterase superfamily enzyme